MTRSISVAVLLSVLGVSALLLLTSGPSVTTTPAALAWTQAPPLPGFKTFDSPCGVTVRFSTDGGAAARIDREGQAVSLEPLPSVSLALEGDTLLAAGATAAVYVFGSFDGCRRFERLGVLPTARPGMQLSRVSVHGDELRVELEGAPRLPAPDDFVWKPLRGLPWPLHRRGGAFISHDRGHSWSME
jgi:hypothetical protein